MTLLVGAPNTTKLKHGGPKYDANYHYRYKMLSTK